MKTILFALALLAGILISGCSDNPHRLNPDDDPVAGNPTIVSVTPATGAAGTTVDIVMKDFVNTDAVTVAGSPVSVNIATSGGSLWRTSATSGSSDDSTVTASLTIPELPEGEAAIKVKRGNYESPAATFTVTVSVEPPTTDQNPEVVSINPTSGEVCSEIEIAMKNFIDTDKILIGDRVMGIIDEPVTPVEGAVVKKVEIPCDGIAEGDVEIKIRRGDYVSPAVTFTVTGEGTGGETGAASTAVVSLSVLGECTSNQYKNNSNCFDVDFDRGKLVNKPRQNTILLEWRLSNVKEASLVLPIADGSKFADFAENHSLKYIFLGDTHHTYLGEITTGLDINNIILNQFEQDLEKEFDATFPANGLIRPRIQQDTHSLPYNYCYIATANLKKEIKDNLMDGAKAVDDSVCTSADATGQSLINIFIPLKDTGMKSGTWAIKAGANTPFMLYYKDLNDKVYKKTIGGEVTKVSQ